MSTRCRLQNFLTGKDVVVIVKFSRACAQGKYVFGRHFAEENLLALVCDADIPFHPAIVKKYRLIPFGGGYFTVDHNARRIWISGRSDTYGPEPDRDLTKRLLETALPTYSVAVEEIDLSDQPPDEGSVLPGRP